MNVKLIGWLTVVAFVLMAVVDFANQSRFAALITLALAVAISPPVFAKIDQPWKRLMNEAGHDGAIVRPASALGLAWLAAIIIMADVAPTNIDPQTVQLTTAEPANTALDTVPVESQSNQVAVQVQPGAKLDLIYAETVRARALVLWRELKVSRDDPSFHRYGLAPAGPMYSWHQQREALYEEWTDYLQTLPVRERFTVSLGSPLSFMYPIAKDWANTAGVGNASNDPMILEIERVIVGGDLSALAYD